MRPFTMLLFLLIVIPLIEIYLLITVGSVIGAFNTVMVVILTAILGATLLRQQGISTLSRLQNHLNQGELPAQEMIEGAILLVTGALLLTPGFFTDFLGFLCLIPTIRQELASKILKKAIIIQSNRQSAGPQIIDGEFSEDDDK